MIPSLIDFLDVVACDTELHFLDRVSRVAANVIFFCFFFPFFSPLFFSVSSVGTNSGRDTVERQNGRKSKRRPERCSRGRERPSKKKKNADVHDGRVIAGPLSEIIQKSRVSG